MSGGVVFEFSVQFLICKSTVLWLQRFVKLIILASSETTHRPASNVTIAYPYETRTDFHIWETSACVFQCKVTEMHGPPMAIYLMCIKIYQ